ncbi:MAG: RNA methyltransferase [Actinomycetota bacterium]|nr:RNA methyltransferase [Actinomycetota bacterium]
MDDALRSDAEVLEVYLADDDHPIVALAEASGVPVWAASDRVIAALSETAAPQGCVAVVRTPEAPLEVAARADLVLVLAEVRDPGNAGTLIRSAAAMGAGCVVVSSGGVDVWSSKTVRASAGSVWRLPVVTEVPLDETLGALRSFGLRVLGTNARAAVPVDHEDLTGRIAFVVGNESRGVGEEARRLVDREVSIPMSRRADSLNAGVAGSVLLYEAARQRRESTRLSLRPDERPDE